MDGVLWRGETPLPGLGRFFQTLRAADYRFILATNNATRTAAMYHDRLRRFGVEVPAEQILTSAEATAHYLRRELPPGASVYAVGARGLQEALEAVGFTLVSPGADGGGSLPPVAAVVVGLAPEAGYRQLATAASLIRAGALFVGTNPDLTLPTESGSQPGAGALLAFVQAASGVAPTIIGKPAPPLLEEALRRMDAEPAETLMVGDRLETDIIGAAALGLQTALVLTGVTRAEELPGAPIRPDRVFAGLDELSDYLERPMPAAVPSDE
jgi:4-nitrophenyl phosphatase